VPTADPEYPFIYELTGGAGVFVAQLAIARDGSVRGAMWGVWVTFPLETTVESPYSAQISVNQDCTGEWTDPTGSWKLIVLDNGAEIVAAPWGGFGGGFLTLHRITRAADPAPRCGQHTLKGNYVMRCEGYVLTGGAGMATGTSLYLLSARDGTMTGTVGFRRFGVPGDPQESGVSATYTVNDDCTVDQRFFLDTLPAGLSFRYRGVLFDQGKQAYNVPMGLYKVDIPVAPELPASCVMTRIGQ
jgi:hypothetical protein